MRAGQRVLEANFIGLVPTDANRIALGEMVLALHLGEDLAAIRAHHYLCDIAEEDGA
jgi:hypothetical protein